MPSAHPAKLFLGLVLAVSVLVRLYCLFLAEGQPIWWDEANYLVKAKSLALGTPATGFDAGRPVLFSMLMAPSFTLGLGEFGIRIGLTVASVLCVYLVYRIGARLMNPWVGTVGAALFSCHYLSLFYTARFMCEIPYVTCLLLALVFFLSENRALLWACGPLFAAAVMLRYPAFIILLSIAFYVLVTEGSRALRNKDHWTCLGLAVLTVAPDLLLRGRDTVNSNAWLILGRSVSERWVNLGEAVAVFWGMWDPVSQTALSAGVLLCLWYVLTWKARAPRLRQAHLLLACWMVGPILLHGFCIHHLEDRYLYGGFAPACLLIASALWHLGEILPARAKRVAFGIACVWLSGICAWMISGSTALITTYRTSYEEFQIVGKWLKDQNDPTARVVTENVAQITYYTEMACLRVPKQKQEFLELMNSRTARYAVITGLEAHPEWVKPLDLRSTGIELKLSYPEKSPWVVVLKGK